MLIIGITGGTGSGKTTFVNQLIAEFSENEITVISQDSYYKDISSLNQNDRAKINFDHPQSIDFELLIAHLSELKKGKSIEQPNYSFNTHNRLQKTTKTIPKKVIIIEGILIFNNDILRNLIDIKVFLEVDSDERLIRRIQRDTTERGRDLTAVLNRYQSTLKPMHQKFIETAKTYANIIIPNNKPNPIGISIVKTIINEKLA